MKTIKAIHKAVNEPTADLVLYRAMPAQDMPMNALNPFIFLKHHDLQEYHKGKLGSENAIMK